jgi:hypothetical protein
MQTKQEIEEMKIEPDFMTEDDDEAMDTDPYVGRLGVAEWNPAEKVSTAGQAGSVVMIGDREVYDPSKVKKMCYLKIGIGEAYFKPVIPNQNISIAGLKTCFTYVSPDFENTVSNACIAGADDEDSDSESGDFGEYNEELDGIEEEESLDIDASFSIPMMVTKEIIVQNPLQRLPYPKI